MDEREYFTEAEAMVKVGRRIKTCDETYRVPSIPVGITGTVMHLVPIDGGQSGYWTAVRWDDDRFESVNFNRWHFANSLTELKSDE